MRREQIQSIIRFLYKTLTHTTVVGLENVPKQGGCLLATNHISRLDPPLVFALLDREKVTALVADKYKKYPFLGWLVEAVEGIWLNREQLDMRALREAITFLREGGALGIAPEGTRSQTRALIAAKTGVAYLADKAGVPIVPAAVTGTEYAIKAVLRLRRPRIRILFGRPFMLPPVDAKDRSAALQRNTDEIMCQIAALLPPEYRGVYAGHPRVQEILSERKEDPEVAFSRFTL
jgi:1-acyl-sn-glycerol-3-phosphate acyltransferase